MWKKIGLGVCVVTIISGLLILLAPIGPMPGFFIGGTPTPPPAQWGDTSDVVEVRLGVEDDLPYVVIIWVVQVDNALYVVGADDSNWVSKVGFNGPVELRIDDSTYTLYANRLTEGQLPILEAYQAKYRADYPGIVEGMGSPQEMIAGAAVYRLDR